MGRHYLEIPMASPHEIDVSSFCEALKNIHPELIYIDQATMLFPLDISSLRSMIDNYSPSTILHYDTSHLNGLILGDAIVNPLEQGADLFGGSTHKTFPGPHKGFLATNREDIAKKVNTTASHFVSHHHSSELVSLALSLFEFDQCGGDQYARRVIENSQLFAQLLHSSGINVAAAGQGFTGCHQIWVTPQKDSDVSCLARNFEYCGLILNVFSSLPGIDQPSFRISLAEITRMGAKTDHIHYLANAFVDLIVDRKNKDAVAKELLPLKSELSVPHYCLSLSDLHEFSLEKPVVEFCSRNWIGSLA